MMEQHNLGRTVFMIGGTDSECRKLCLELAGRGCAVGFTYGSDESAASELSSQVESAGGRALALRAASFSAEELSAAIVETAEKLGGIGSLFFFRTRGTGQDQGGMLLDLDEEDWDAEMNRSAKGFFLSCKYALPYLIGQEGSVIAALDPLSADGSLMDGVSGAALQAAAEHISRELSNYGVMVIYEKISGDDWAARVSEEALSRMSCS